MHLRSGLAWRLQRAAMRATGPARVLPTFLLIGAPQCGTTSFFSYLIRHPGVLPALVKEVRFFNRNYERGIGWYRSFFPLRVSISIARRRLGYEPAIGEGSPAYLLDPRVPARVHSLDPELRLIVLLRDPVDRAHSQYRLAWRSGKERLSLEDALEAEPERVRGELERMQSDPAYFSRPFHLYAYQARGCYADHLERWLRLFPREQLLVLSTEELRRDPASVVADAARFLGLPPWRPTKNEYARRNAQSHEEMEPEVRELLAGRFVEANRRLYELVGRDFGWTRPLASDPAGVGEGRGGGPRAC